MGLAQVAALSVAAATGGHNPQKQKDERRSVEGVDDLLEEFMAVRMKERSETSVKINISKGTDIYSRLSQDNLAGTSHIYSSEECEGI